MEKFTYRIIINRIGLLMLLCGLWSSALAQFGGSPRVDDLLSGAAYDAGQAELILVKDGRIVYQQVFSDVQSASEKKVRIASSAKWLVAATLLTLVDDKLITLDEPIGKYLPQFKSTKANITLRELLSHTSGLPVTVPYLKNKELSLAQTVDSIAKKVNLLADPGTQFLYGNTSYQVAGRLAEVVSGKDWESLFREKVALPCKMTKTDFGNQRGKNIGEGAYSTASDYANFLQMILNKGSYNGTQVLSQKAIEEMVRDQTTLLPEEEFSPFRQVSARKSQFYGLGVWIDRIMPLDSTAIEVSCQGDKGFTPWVNFCKNLGGVYSFYVDLNDVAPAIENSKAIIDETFKDYCKDISTKKAREEAASPATRQTTIFFRLEKESKVTLKLFDPLGNEVMLLKNGMLKAGDYTIPLDISRLNQGVYFYRLEIDGILETKRITIKK